MVSLKKYQSREMSINDHKQNYRSQGHSKGKFKSTGPDKYRIRKIVDNVPMWAKVLDCGCNDGDLGALLQSERSAIVYGIDVVDELVAIAETKGVLARTGCVEKLEFRNNMFDVVVMAEVMEHLFDPEEGLAEIHRVIKPNGIFLGSVPHSEGTLGFGKKADYHQSIFTLDDLNQLLTKYFNSVEITETPYSQKFCQDNNIPLDQWQWRNWVCMKKCLL